MMCKGHSEPFLRGEGSWLVTPEGWTLLGTDCISHSNNPQMWSSVFATFKNYYNSYHFLSTYHEADPCSILLYSHDNQETNMIQLYRQGNWGSKTRSDFLKFTQFSRGKIRALFATSCPLLIVTVRHVEIILPFTKELERSGSVCHFQCLPCGDWQFKSYHCVLK
jgi:hypothetical protein